MNQDYAESCLRYLDGDLSQDELRAFEQLLVTSPDAADLLSQLAMDEQHYRTTPAASDDNVLADLLKLEAIAQPLPHDAAWHDDAGQAIERPADDYQGTLKALGDPSFWGYLAKATMRSKPMKWAGAAAVVLLAATLLIVFVSGPSNTSQTPDIAGTHNDPARVAPTNPLQTNAVATITATHNAAWAGPKPAGDLRRGSALHPNDRLTLTAGFAEITTNDGAIVILEAPASIELIDHNNALRLHAGKLVGICETDSSKGFLVHTPHMDVTDLGTRFGVHVEDAFSQPTHVQVFQGSVRMESLASETATLFAGQAMAAGAEGLMDAEFDTTRYAQAVTGRVELAALAANPFGIANPSFEWVALEDDMLLREEVSGWILSNPKAAVVANPGQDETRYYDPALALDVNGATVGDMHGRSVFFFSINQPGASLSQTLAVRAEIGTTYTLTVAIGDRMKKAIYRPNFAGYNIELLAGDQVLASLNASPQQSPGKGTFTDVSLTYTVQPDDPAGLLGIRLSTNRTNENQVTDFDNIRLTASRIRDGTGTE